MPIAIAVAILVAAGFYTLVSLAALGLMTPDELGRSEAPLVGAVENAGYPGWPIAGLSLWIILNGSLTELLQQILQMNRRAERFIEAFEEAVELAWQPSEAWPSGLGMELAPLVGSRVLRARSTRSVDPS